MDVQVHLTSKNKRQGNLVGFESYPQSPEEFILLVESTWDVTGGLAKERCFRQEFSQENLVFPKLFSRGLFRPVARRVLHAVMAGLILWTMLFIDHGDIRLHE